MTHADVRHAAVTAVDFSYGISGCSFLKISAARSPMMTQAAIVFPVVTRGQDRPVGDSKTLWRVPAD
jgi:hypothetical protein